MQDPGRQIRRREAPLGSRRPPASWWNTPVRTLVPTHRCVIIVTKCGRIVRKMRLLVRFGSTAPH